jgi:hypothetical protein
MRSNPGATAGSPKGDAAMNWMRKRAARLAALAGAGFLFQGTCALDAQALAYDLATQIISAIVAALTDEITATTV